MFMVSTTAVRCASELVRKKWVSSHVGSSEDLLGRVTRRDLRVNSWTMYRSATRLVTPRNMLLPLFLAGVLAVLAVAAVGSEIFERADMFVPSTTRSLIIPVARASTPEFSMMGMVIFAGYTKSGATNFHRMRRRAEYMPGSAMRSMPGGW